MVRGTITSNWHIFAVKELQTLSLEAGGQPVSTTDDVMIGMRVNAVGHEWSLLDVDAALGIAQQYGYVDAVYVRSRATEQDPHGRFLPIGWRLTVAGVGAKW